MVSDSQWDEYHAYLWERAKADPRDWFLSLAFQKAYTRSREILKIVEYTMEMVTMRGKKKTDRAEAPKKVEWVGFLNIHVPEAAADDIFNAFPTAESVLDGMVELLSSGHKVNFSVDRQSDAVVCSVTGVEAGTPNAGYTLTSFAGTWLDALRVSLYKHEVMAQGNWSSVATQPNKRLFG